MTVSHTMKADGGTTFIHNGDYSGDVRIQGHTRVRAWEALATGEVERWEVTVPFADLRELVFAYLRMKMTVALENASDDTFEQMVTNGSGVAW